MKYTRPYSRENMTLPPKLETERLNLRLVTKEDVDLFWDLESDPQVQKYFEEVADNFDEFQTQFNKDYDTLNKYKFFYLMVEKKTGKKAGAVVLRPTKDGNWIEVGYKLPTAFWGKGYGTETTKKLIEVGHKNWGAKHFMAISDPQNTGSINIMKKAGMDYHRKMDHLGKEVVQYILIFDDQKEGPLLSREKLSLPDKLTTKRLFLTPIDQSCFECFWEMESDPKVMAFIYPPKTNKTLFKEEFITNLEGGTYKFYRTLKDQISADLYGWVFARPTEDGKWVELGYRLVQKSWGKGYIPEALKSLVPWVQENWKTDYIMACIDEGNSNSEKAAEKIGLQYDRHIYAYETYIQRYILQK